MVKSSPWHCLFFNCIHDFALCIYFEKYEYFNSLIDMRKALSRDKEKKSMIPLKRPVRPDELDWPWARWITMETSCYGYYWGQPFLFWFQFCTFWSENLDFPQMMHPLPAQISKTWKYGERREGGGVVTDSVQCFAEVIKNVGHDIALRPQDKSG